MVERPIKKSERAAQVEPTEAGTPIQASEGTSARPIRRERDGKERDGKERGKERGRGKGKREDREEAKPVNLALARGPKPTKPKPEPEPAPVEEETAEPIAEASAEAVEA